MSQGFQKKMISRNEVAKRVSDALQPMFKIADEWALSEKAYALACDETGQFTLVKRDEIGKRKKIINITEFMLHEKLTPNQWDKIIVKAAIYLASIGLYDRSMAINEKKQLKL